MGKISTYDLIDELSLEDESVVNDATELDAAKRTKRYSYAQVLALLKKVSAFGKKPFEVAYATTANIALSGNLSLDGSGALSNGTLVLVKDQSDLTENGVYVVDASTWTRSTDFDSASELDGAIVYVRNGTEQTGFTYWQSTPSPDVGTDDIVFDTLGGGAVPIPSLSEVIEAGTGLEVTNSTHRTALKTTSNFVNPNDASDTLYAIMTANAPTGYIELSYYIGIDTTTNTLFKYQYLNIDSTLKWVRTPMQIGISGL